MPIYETSSDPSHPTSRCYSFCIKPHSNAIQSPPSRKNQTYQPHPPPHTPLPPSETKCAPLPPPLFAHRPEFRPFARTNTPIIPPLSRYKCPIIRPKIVKNRPFFAQIPPL